MADNTLPKNKVSRDSRIELLRLICCFFVVALHCKPGSSIAGVPSFPRYLFSNIIADAVSTFLMITGFFFASDEKYSVTLRKNIKRIFLPMITYTVILVAYAKGFSSLSTVKDSVLSIGKCLVTWTPFIHNTGHLWYLYVHLLIILLSPIIKFVLKKIRLSRYAECGVLVMILVLFWVNDSLSNGLFRCSQIPVTSLLPGILLVIMGNIIYHLVETEQILHKLFFLYIAAFIGINIYRAKLLTSGDIQMSDATFSLMGVLCAVFLSLFFLTLPKFPPRIGKCINWLSSFTLGIYIWHVLTMEITGTIGLKIWFISLITDGSESFGMYFRYTVLFSLLIMAICTIWSLILRCVNSIILKLCSKISSP